MLPYNGSLKGLGRELRKNMTQAERLLWSKIRMRQVDGCQFYRQKIIGDYIVDFYCPKARLVVEVDGGQHYSDRKMAADRERDAYLEAQGLTVLRFGNTDVLGNIAGVTERLFEYVQGRARAGNPP